MPLPCPIADYAARLSRELAFDPRLSRRMQREVEDHLWDAAAAEPGEATLEAQWRAIEQFGDPREIAAQYAAPSLFRQTKRVSATAALVIAAIFMTMKGRVAWYATMQWGVGDDLRPLIDVAMPLLRFAFMAAVGLGVIGLAYAISYRTPTKLRPVDRRQLRVSQLLCAAAAAAIAFSVGTDVILTAARLAERPWSQPALVPAGLIAIEIILTTVLAVQLRRAVRGTTLAASFL